jgi:hypothetical protein
VSRIGAYLIVRLCRTESEQKVNSVALKKCDRIGSDWPCGVARCALAPSHVVLLVRSALSFGMIRGKHIGLTILGERTQKGPTEVV